MTKLCAERLAYLKRLSTWLVYKNGWDARVRDVEREALKLAAAPLPDVEPPAPVEPPKSVWDWLKGKLNAA